MSSGVTWVAIAALGLSVVSLAWQIGAAIWRRGRIKVGLVRATQFDFDEETLVKRGDTTVEFTLTISNSGASAVTVYDAGLLEPEQGVSTSLKLMQMTNREQAERGGPEQRAQYVGPDLPVEVPARGVVEWQLLDSFTAKSPADRQYRGYAEQYRAGRSHKTTYSMHTMPRGMQYDPD